MKIQYCKFDIYNSLKHMSFLFDNLKTLLFGKSYRGLNIHFEHSRAVK